MMNRKHIKNILESRKTRELTREADEARRRYVGREVFIRAIIEFSNYCARNCLYCGLRRGNLSLRRYRMSEEEIMAAVLAVKRDGIGTVILQSGDDLSFSRSKICRVIQKIKSLAPGMAVTLSIGERPLEDYQAFFEAGADRYLLKIETSNPRLYEILHPGQTLKKRLEILQRLKKIGYQVGTGNIVGLPGQTIDDLAGDILFLQEFQPEMIGIGPFIAQGDTPLAVVPSPALDLVLKSVALARLAVKAAHIPSTTALHTLNPRQGHGWALRAGANVLMINYTPDIFKTDYALYDDKRYLSLKEAARIVESVKRKVSCQRGDAFRLAA